MKKNLMIGMSVGILLVLSACGQKGPLIVDEPPVEASVEAPIDTPQDASTQNRPSETDADE